MNIRGSNEVILFTILGLKKSERNNKIILKCNSLPLLNNRIVDRLSSCIILL